MSCARCCLRLSDVLPSFLNESPDFSEIFGFRESSDFTGEGTTPVNCVEVEGSTVDPSASLPLAGWDCFVTGGAAVVLVVV